MKNRLSQNVRSLALIALTIISPISHVQAQAIGGVGSNSADLPFFLNGGNTPIGDWTPVALSVNGIGALSGDLRFLGNGGAIQLGDWSPTSLNVVGGFTTTGDAVVSGSVTALYYAHTSDARLKTNIHPVHHALEKLLALQGVTFKWRANGQTDMGVIAQNVEEVFPSIVHTNQNGMKSVEYDALIAAVIEALRELKVDNEELRLELAAKGIINE